MPYKIQSNPSVIPANDGKLIKEHFGFASIKTGDYSVAHMIAPPGWSEPFQTPIVGPEDGGAEEYRALGAGRESEGDHGGAGEVFVGLLPTLSQNKKRDTGGAAQRQEWGSPE